MTAKVRVNDETHMQNLLGYVHPMKETTVYAAFKLKGKNKYIILAAVSPLDLFPLRKEKMLYTEQRAWRKPTTGRLSADATTVSSLAGGVSQTLRRQATQEAA